MTRILIEPLIDPKTGGSGKHFVWAFGTWPSGSGFRKHSKSYFTFLTTPEIGLTNNTAATQVNFLISESETPWVHPEGAKLIQTDPIHQSAALKWRKMIAQGKARRRPGFAFPNISQALKGRHNCEGHPQNNWSKHDLVRNHRTQAARANGATPVLLPSAARRNN